MDENQIGPNISTAPVHSSADMGHTLAGKVLPVQLEGPVFKPP